MKEDNVGNDHIDCLLLCNKFPQNFVPQMNEHLLSPFLWLSWVGLAESCMRLQTRHWLALHYLKARLGRQDPLPNSLTGSPLSCRPTRRAAGVSSRCGGWLLPEQITQERKPGGSHSAFYDLVSEVTRHHFCHILFIRSESLSPVHSQREGMRLCFGGKNIRGFIDLF